MEVKMNNQVNSTSGKDKVTLSNFPEKQLNSYGDNSSNFVNSKDNQENDVSECKKPSQNSENESEQAEIQENEESNPEPQGFETFKIRNASGNEIILSSSSLNLAQLSELFLQLCENEHFNNFFSNGKTKSKSYYG